jgi:TadE-like protein
MPSDRPASTAHDRGMVTAELAACLPVLMVVLAVVLTAVSVVAARVRAQDAAREAARAVARHDDAVARAAVAQVAPGARLVVTAEGGFVEAVVRQRVRPLGGWLPGFTVVERSVAAVEPQAGDAPAPVPP